mgnify:CR=1 FL=1
MNSNHNGQHNFAINGLQCFGSIIFLDNNMIKSNDDLAKKALNDLYQHISYN